MSMIVRSQSRALTKQWRRAFASRVALSSTGISPGKASHNGQTSAASGNQQQRHLNATPAAVPTLNTPFPPSMLRNIEVKLPEASLQDALPSTVVRCDVVNSGKQVVVEFADRSRYEFHSAWLKDSHPLRRGADFYRTSAADVWKLGEFSVTGASASSTGSELSVTFSSNGTSQQETFESQWLHAFAPHVGKALEGSPKAAAIKGTSSLFDKMLPKRRAWTCDTDMPEFSAKALVSSTDLQAEFLENMIEKGIAIVTEMGTPNGSEREAVGQPMYDLIFKIIGKLNMHPVRSTNWGVIRKTAESAKQGSDYDMSNPLSMHTDHTVYHGTPGFLQFLYQAQGNVRSKVCDGLALAEYVKTHHPHAYELLTTVPVTHSSRNCLYTPEGAPRDVNDKTTSPAPFELVHTHPVIELDSNGRVEKVVQSETKRGVCAVPYEVYQPFMEAYELWTQLCEDARFIKHFDWPEGTMVVTNNWRTLHGRASVPPGMPRTLAFGYVNKVLVENRYRLLRQMQTERAHPHLDHRWLTRIPNQVLDTLTLKA